MRRKIYLNPIPIHFAAAFVLAFAAAAGEAPGDGPAIAPPIPVPFAPAPSRRPNIGEWLEYRVCYPVDPLENELSGEPVAPAAAAVTEAAEEAMAAAEATADASSSDPAGAGAEEGAGYLYLPPSFTPAPAWRELPLRLEVVQVDADDCRAVMRFGNLRREVVLPNRDVDYTETGKEKFTFLPPQPDDTEQVVSLDGETFTCQLTRRDGGEGGFARLWSVDLPFGLARFATADVDIILVGKGTGLPPAFPLRVREPITPSPGMFYIPAAIPQS